MDYRYDHILIRYGELSLKGKNRNVFIRQLKENIKNAILDGVIPNEYDAAYAYMLECAAKMGLSPAKKM